MKTKISTEVVHVIYVNRTPLSRSKGQTSRSPGRFTYRGLNACGRCSGDRANVLGVGKLLLRYVCSAAREALGRPRGERGAGHIVSPRAPLVPEIKSLIDLLIDFNFALLLSEPSTPPVDEIYLLYVGFREMI